jgi:hypothetical protein
MVMERKPWLSGARKKVYRTQQEWIQILNEMGLKYPQSTIANWEASGFLPYSLSSEALNIVCRSLRMNPVEVFRLQGIDIPANAQGIHVPACAINLVRQFGEADERLLEKMMPVIEAHYKAVMDISQGERL